MLLSLTVGAAQEIWRSVEHLDLVPKRRLLVVRECLSFAVGYGLLRQRLVHDVLIVKRHVLLFLLTFI